MALSQVVPLQNDVHPDHNRCCSERLLELEGVHREHVKSFGAYSAAAELESSASAHAHMPSASRDFRCQPNEVVVSSKLPSRQWF